MYFAIGFVIGIALFIVMMVPYVVLLGDSITSFIDDDDSYIEIRPYFELLVPDEEYIFLGSVLYGSFVILFSLLAWPLVCMGAVIYGLMHVARSIKRINKKLEKIDG